MNYEKMYNLKKCYRHLLLDIFFETSVKKKQEILSCYNRLRKKETEASNYSIFRVLSLFFCCSVWEIRKIVLSIKK